MQESRNIRAELARHDMTLEDLGHELGISGVSVGNKINGRTGWTLAEAKRVVDLFNSKGSSVDIESLFFNISVPATR